MIIDEERGCITASGALALGASPASYPAAQPPITSLQTHMLPKPLRGNNHTSLTAATRRAHHHERISRYSLALCLRSLTTRLTRLLRQHRCHGPRRTPRQSRQREGRIEWKKEEMRSRRTRRRVATMARKEGGKNEGGDDEDDEPED